MLLGAVFVDDFFSFESRVFIENWWWVSHSCGRFSKFSFTICFRGRNLNPDLCSHSLVGPTKMKDGGSKWTRTKCSVVIQTWSWRGKPADSTRAGLQEANDERWHFGFPGRAVSVAPRATRIQPESIRKVHHKPIFFLVFWVDSEPGLKSKFWKLGWAGSTQICFKKLDELHRFNWNFVWNSRWICSSRLGEFAISSWCCPYWNIKEGRI